MLEKKIKILGAKNHRKNLHKHPGPPFQIKGGPGSFSNAQILVQKYEPLLKFLTHTIAIIV